jgi:uncharacterized membrane protein YdjX (TVP38/TMEM64 family)/rhodanese-related sulfurtransferase
VTVEEGKRGISESEAEQRLVEEWQRRFFWMKALIFSGIFLGFGVLYSASSEFQLFFHTILHYFKPTESGFDLIGLQEYLMGFGAWKAAVLSSFLMVVQAIIAPLPALLLTMTNGLMFGAFWGGLLSLLSATLAAQLCYEMALFLGRPLVTALIPLSVLERTDRFIKKHGAWTILIGRLVPIIPFDPLSYVAGLSKVSRIHFILGNLLGQIPATFIYSTFGASLVRNPNPLLIFFLLMLLALLALWLSIWSAHRQNFSRKQHFLSALGVFLVLSGGSFFLYTQGNVQMKLFYACWKWAKKAGAPTISIAEFQRKQAQERFLILDARTLEEYEVSHLPKALSFTLEDWKSKGWPQGWKSPVLVYCTIGYRSGLLTNALREKGIDAYNLYGGIFQWAYQDLPLENRLGSTAFVHPYDEKWGSLLGKPERLKYKP